MNYCTTLSTYVWRVWDTWIEHCAWDASYPLQVLEHCASLGEPSHPQRVENYLTPRLNHDFPYYLSWHGVMPIHVIIDVHFSRGADHQMLTQEVRSKSHMSRHHIAVQSGPGAKELLREELLHPISTCKPSSMTSRHFSGFPTLRSVAKLLSTSVADARCWGGRRSARTATITPIMAVTSVSEALAQPSCGPSPNSPKVLPIAKQSDRRGAWGWFWQTSGGQCCTQPGFRLVVASWCSSWMAASKSRSLKPLWLLAMLWALMSLWATRALWRCSSPVVTSAKACFKFCGRKPGAHASSYKVGPKSSSRTPLTWPCFWMIATTSTSSGCLRRCSSIASACTAFRSISICPIVRKPWSLHSFTAPTVPWNFARCTVARPPWPSFSMTSTSEKSTTRRSASSLGSALACEWDRVAAGKAIREAHHRTVFGMLLQRRINQLSKVLWNLATPAQAMPKQQEAVKVTYLVFCEVRIG